MKIVRPVKVLDTGGFSRLSNASYWNKNGLMVHAGSGVARVAYDPTDLKKPPYFLFENAATNLLTYSEQFSDSSWTKTGSLIADSTSALDGGSADRLVETSTVSECKVTKTRSGSSETLTLSIFVKPFGRNYVKLSMTNSATYSCGAQFDLAAGVVAQIDSANADYVDPSAQIFKLVNGWFRCTFTVTKKNINNTNQPVINVFGSAGVLSYQGNGTSGCYVWGAQLETGSIASSYIPSTNSVGSRSADVNTKSMLSTLPETDATPYSATKTYMLGEQVIVAAIHRKYESSTGRSAYVTFAAPNGDITWAGNGLTVGQPVRFSTSGSLPNQINTTTTYYVYSIIDPAHFTIADSVGASEQIYPSGSSTGFHQCLTADNVGKQPQDNPSVWLDAGPTNAWAMFDESVESQTTAADAVVVSLALSSSTLVDCVILQNIRGATHARVVMTGPTDGVVFDKTISLISTRGIGNFAKWFFEPITYLQNVIFYGLPRYTGTTVSVSLSNTGSNVSCGLCVLGLTKYIGPTQAGLQLGIQDFSVKETDEFGNSRVVPRSYNKSMSATVWVEIDEMDTILDMLNDYRTIPIVYIGDETNDSTALYGYFKDYTMGVNMPTASVLNIEIESLK